MTNVTRCAAAGIVGAVLFAVGSGAAEDPRVNRDADHVALRMLMTNVTEAVNSQAADKLVTYFTKDFIFTAVDQTVLTNAASITNFYHQMVGDKNSPLKSVALNPSADSLTRFLSDTVGCCYGTSDDVYTLRKNDRTITVASRWTAVVVKEEGQWKVAAVHSAVNFLDNPVLEARTMSLWRKMMLGLGFGKYPGEK